MQLSCPLRGLAVCGWLFVASLSVASPTHADEASGTWTGALEARGNYYWETSTRVIAPEVTAQVESPDGVRLRAHYLVDSITSASVASGVLTDVRFTEIRHDAGFGTGREFDLGDAQLDLSANARYSQEPDYSSLSANVGASLSLNERATVLSLSVTTGHDEVGAILRGGEVRIDPETGRNLSDRGKQGNLDAFVTSFLVSQVLAPTLTLDFGYDLGLLYGFLQNPYRRVVVNSVLLNERHPDQRTRHTVHGRLAWLFEPTNTSIHLLYRAYVDNWDIAALTPEVRLYQELGDLAMLRLRYRYYTQRRAYFQDDSGYTDADDFFTADPKMTAFESHLVGGLLVVHLDFLERSVLDFAWRATLELGLEYVFRTNRYGNGVIGQIGLRIPF